MQHFEIILSIARMALNGDEKRLESQLKKLRDALSDDDPKQAQKIARLLSRNDRKQEFAPMSLERMRASGSSVFSLPGETLTKSTPLPVDKETAAPLARVLFADDLPNKEPILNGELSSAISDLLGEWDRLEELAKLGVSPNTRCLIYGAPGVGKTLLAHYIAKKLDLPLVEARLDGLVSSFLGTSARNIGTLFDFVDRYRCILFLDEFDAIAKARDDGQEVGEIKRVVNTLLQSLDSRTGRGFTLAATNHEHLLDRAVWRRFEARIYIPVPSPEIRETILTGFLEPVRLSDSEMKLVSWLTEGMSGADLETLVTGGKRYLVLHSENDKGTKNKGQRRKQREALLSALRRQATLNAKLFDERRHKLLLGPNKKLMDAIIQETGLKQKEAAELIGVSQSTISRRRKSSIAESLA